MLANNSYKELKALCSPACVMKNLKFILLLFWVSCFPSMQEGPVPHSIEFEEDKFNEVVAYLNNKPDIEGFEVINPPSIIPDSIIEKMKDLGFLEYRNLGEYKVLFCGYSVVGKGWGFIYGEFAQSEIEQPQLIRGRSKTIDLTYLEHLKGKWCRFGAG